MDYRQLVHIDEANLDKEWATAGARYLEVVDAHVRASEQLGQLQTKVSAFEAAMDSAVRADPERYGLPKATDTSVKNAIVRMDQYQLLQQDILNARRDLGMLAGLLTAMEHRRKGLENLVQLYLANYRGEPRIKAEDKAAIVSQANRKHHDLIGARMKK